MVNAMTKEGNSQPVTDPRLVPEVLNMIDEESVGDYWEEEDEWILPARLSETELRELLIERRLSEDDVDFNLKVLRIRNIAFHQPNLVPLKEEEYHCSRIMALSLAVKEIERYIEETRQLLRNVGDPQDKQALNDLMYLLATLAGESYREDLLHEARRVGAVRSRSYVHEGAVVNHLEEPNYELIEARFSLDGIWDREPSMFFGTREDYKQLVKALARKLDGDPKVVEVRRSLDIPPDGFKDLDAAHQWSRSGDRLPDWSRCDDAYREELVWWESYTWDPDSESPLARGYIMLHVPVMNEPLERLVGEHKLHPSWRRVLPLYLIRGKLEPPPKVKKGQPRKKERDDLLTALVDEHGYELAQMIYNGGLAPEDVASILERNSRISPDKLDIALWKLADKRDSWLPTEKRVSYDALRKLVSRTRTRRAAYATYKERVTQMGV